MLVVIDASPYTHTYIDLDVDETTKQLLYETVRAKIIRAYYHYLLPWSREYAHKFRFINRRLFIGVLMVSPYIVYNIHKMPDECSEYVVDDEYMLISTQTGETCGYVMPMFLNTAGGVKAYPAGLVAPGSIIRLKRVDSTCTLSTQFVSASLQARSCIFNYQVDSNTIYIEPYSEIALFPGMSMVDLHVNCRPEVPGRRASKITLYTPGGYYKISVLPYTA